MFINPAFAQQAAATVDPAAVAGNPARILLQFLIIFVVFYFFLIRPQQKRMKDHQAMQLSVARGDIIVTTGGIVGKVIRSNAEDLVVEIADGVRVTVVRDRIAGKRSSPVRLDTSDADAEESNAANMNTKKGSEGLKDILTKK